MIFRRAIARLIMGCVSIVLMPVIVYAVYATFSDGMQASDALGQYDDDLVSPSPLYTRGSANGGLNRLGSSTFFNTNNLAVDAVHHRLFLPDTTQGRIMVYNLNSDNTLIDRVPDNVLGSTDFHSSDGSVTLPIAVAYDSMHDRLFVAQVVAAGIEVFDTTTITDGELPVYMIGRPTNSADSYGVAAATASGTSIAPYGLAYDSNHNRLFASDFYYNRVTVYDLDNIATGMNASYVLGQRTFTSTTAATSASGMSVPFGLAYDNTRNRLFVADNANARVLVFSGASISTGMRANYVIGQTGSVTSTARLTRAGLGSPTSVTIDESGNRLFVADGKGFGGAGLLNHRILMYDLDTLATGMNADNVLGQTNFVNATGATTQSGLNKPSGVIYEPTSGYLYNYDGANNRHMIFDVNSITDGESAIDGLGQYDDDAYDPGFIFTRAAANNAPSQWGLSSPRGTVIDHIHDRLFVADTSNNRVLVYDLDTNNEFVDRLPDFVLGQADFHTGTAAATAAGLSGPSAVAYDAERNRIFISDTTNNRIVVYSGASLASGMSAGYVLGQSTFTASAAATTAAGLSAPQGMYYDDVTDKLFVADTGNHRVKIYSGAFLATNMIANTVIGQASFTAASAATTQAGMNTPTDVAYSADDGWLFVADSVNNRVLRYNSPLASSMNASIVLGQTGFTMATTSTTSTKLRVPTGVTFDPLDDRLFVADFSNNRFLMFDASSMTDGMAASTVLGRSNFTSSGAATTQTGLSGPRDSTYLISSNDLYVTDTTNHRVLVYDAAVSSSSVSSSGGGGGGGGGHRGTPGRTTNNPPAVPRSPDAPETSLPGDSSDSTGASDDGAPFEDVYSNTWFTTSVITLIQHGIISGYKDSSGNLTGQYGPSDPVTVGQILKIALLSAGKKLPSSLPLPDNPTATDWSASYIAFAEELNIDLAAETSQRPATRGEVIHTLLQTFNISFSSTTNPFSDLPATHPYASDILTATNLGLVTGDDNASTVRPDAPINRAEIAVLVIRFMEMGE